MSKEWAKAFYKSRAWRKCRASFIAERYAIDGGICQECGLQLGYIVHHRVWLTPQNIDDPDIALNHRYLEYTCHDCHNRIEQGESRYTFGDDGQPIPPLSCALEGAHGYRRGEEDFTAKYV